MNYSSIGKLLTSGPFCDWNHIYQVFFFGGGGRIFEKGGPS